MDFAAIENIMKLMDTYKCDEFASEHFTIKKSVHQNKAAAQRTGAPVQPDVFSSHDIDAIEAWSVGRNAG